MTIINVQFKKKNTYITIFISNTNAMIILAVNVTILFCTKFLKTKQ